MDETKPPAAPANDTPANNAPATDKMGWTSPVALTGLAAVVAAAAGLVGITITPGEATELVGSIASAAVGLWGALRLVKLVLARRG